MSDILAQYGRVTIYNEPNHPSPIYHVEGNIEANPYGDLAALLEDCLLYTSPSPRDRTRSRMPSSA